MKYTKFSDLYDELKLQIIRKCHPVPYTRLRQSCRNMDKFCEKEEKWLRIYCYRKEPQLYLTDTLKMHPFNKIMTDTDEDITEPHVVVNYGKNNGDCSYLMPMRSENISRIKKSLSGFYFFEICLASKTINSDEEGIKKYDEALTYFLEIAFDLKTRYINVGNLTSSQLEIALNTWNARGITAYYSTNTEKMTTEYFKKIVRKEAVKKMTYCSYDLNELSGLDEKLIEEAARGKDKIILAANCLSHEVAMKAWNNLHKIWSNEARFPSYFSFYFIHNLEFYYQHQGYSISNNSCAIRLTKLAYNFSEPPLARKFDIWLYKMPTAWQYISLERIKNTVRTEVYLVRRSYLTKDELIAWLVHYFNVAYPGSAYDFSIFYEKVVIQDRVEELVEEYTKTADALFRFYTQPLVDNKAPIPNLLMFNVV